MAQTVAEIKKGMTDQFIADENIVTAYNLAAGKTFEDQFSVVSIESIFFYVVAFCCWLQQVLFDTLQADNLSALALKKPHTLRWYSEQAKLYQYGFPLTEDHSSFDNSGYTEEAIAASKVVSYAAVIEQSDVNGRIYLRMKLAHDNGEDLEQLSSDELTAFKEWFNSYQKDAGVKLQIDSLPADNLRQTWTIFYDPLILDSTGSRLDGTGNTPVQDAIKGYLKNLPFNGVYVPTYHIDAVQAVEGVVIPQLQTVEAKYGNLAFRPGAELLHTGCRVPAVCSRFGFDINIHRIIACKIEYGIRRQHIRSKLE